MQRIDLETSCGRVCVYKKGIGAKKIVLLHGAGCDSALLSWQEVMERLHYDDYTVYAPDLPGYGNSDYPEQIAGAEFYQTHANVLQELCDALELQDMILTGLSMGAAIAVRFTLDHPDRVEHLVLIDPWGVTERLPFQRLCARYVKKEKRMQKWYERMANSRLLARWMIAYELIGDRKKITPELITEVQQACATEMAGKSMRDYQVSSLLKKGCVPYYKKEDWERLPMQVIFIQGEKDPLVAAKDVRAASELVSFGRYIEWEGAKHWSVREYAAELVGLFAEIVS